MKQSIRLSLLSTFLVGLLTPLILDAAPRRAVEGRFEIPISDWDVPGQSFQQEEQLQIMNHQVIQTESVTPSGEEWISADALPSRDGNFIAIAPCRVADTRNPTGPYGGPAITSGDTREFDIDDGPCGVPANAIAYSLNFTVVSPSASGWIQVGPGGSPVPFVSTLNFGAGQTVANAAIVPSGPGGTIAVKAANATIHLIIDINGYFPEQVGHVINNFVGNVNNPPGGMTGYLNIISNYVAPVNATAFITVRCSYDGSAAGQMLNLRAARRTPTGTGSVATGAAFFLDVHTPGPNLSVMNVNSDFLNLVGGNSYDFGAYFADPTPSGGTGNDWCSATVMVTRR
jgi:hypothetical protein